MVREKTTSKKRIADGSVSVGTKDFASLLEVMGWPYPQPLRMREVERDSLDDHDDCRHMLASSFALLGMTHRLRRYGQLGWIKSDY